MSQRVGNSGAMDCLTDETIAAFAGGELPAQRVREIEEHLRSCGDCTALMAAYARGALEHRLPDGASSGSMVAGQDPGEDPEPLAPGTIVSRYEILRFIGRGGGGTVHEAYDPQLRRQVGLKLLRPGVGPVSGLPAEEAQARLLREAHAMAQLSHPNVLGVHDAGIFEGDVFIVMEFVRGKTLGDWLAERPRPWREVLDLFCAAGRGLAAVHAADLLHRDFKPDNVLIGGDGRPRVSDFGLARPIAGTERPSPANAIAGSKTIVGGTPFYMAPEQFERKAPDARTDQFSFCVALFWALHGRHPFGLEARRAWSSPALSRPPASLKIDPPPDTRGVPAAVQQVITRGLRTDPAERWPSLDVLLAALERAASPPRSVLRLASPVVAVLALALLAGWAIRARGTLPPRCGNGVVDPGEECDGPGRSKDGACTPTCLRCTGSATFFWPDSGHCYTRHDQPSTWHEARSACEAAGETLVTYSGPAEASAVLQALVPDTTRASWIGLHRASTIRGFVWLTGDPWADNLADWWKTEPSSEGHDCVFQMRGPAGLLYARWPTARCEERRPFVCERAPWSVLPRTNHAFRVFHSRVTWRQARATCQRLGGDLASVQDAEEHAFLRSLVGVEVWLGGTDEAREGEFAWTDGTSFAFRAFAPGEPDDRERRSQCLLLGADDVWHDRPCTTINAFLCEMGDDTGRGSAR